MNLSTQSDEELLRRAGHGCRPSFAELYRRHQKRVYRFALQMSGSATAAEEVTQEAFVALLGGENFTPGQGLFEGYLLGIARHHVLRLLRNGRRSVPLEDGTAEPAAPPPVLNDMARRELIGEVRRAVLALPIHYREVVVLCDLEEMEYEAAARTLECAVGTVRSRLHRARLLLAEKLTAGRKPSGCPV